MHLLNPAVLHDAFSSFQRGNRRLLVLFRHVDLADGPVVLYALSEMLRRYDRRVGRDRHASQAPNDGGRLLTAPHVHFLYGKDVLAWAGPGARAVFPRLGGIPVSNTRLDRRSHDAIRNILIRGDFPLALAPEGQVTYQAFHVSELTPGAGTLAHWAERELAERAGTQRTAREPAVRADAAWRARVPAERAGEQNVPRIAILPIAVGYHRSRDLGRLLDSVVDRIETAVGRRFRRVGGYRATLIEATETIVTQLEGYCRQAYPHICTKPDRAPLSRRIGILCDCLIRSADASSPKHPNPGDSLLQRLFALRFHGLDLRFREDVDPQTLPPFDRGWADLRAAEAQTMDRHAQIVDILLYIRPEYIEGNPSDHRLVEYALNLLDVTNRVNGGRIATRYSPPGMRAALLAGEPIDATEHFREATESRKGAIRRLSALTHDALARVSSELEHRIDEVR